MAASTQRPFSSIELKELLALGGNTSLGSGVIVYDNIEDEKFSILGRHPFENMLVKPRFDVVLLCIEGKLNYGLECNYPVTVEKGEIAYFKQDQIVEISDSDMRVKVMLMAFPHIMSDGIDGFDEMEIGTHTAHFYPSEKDFNRLKELYFHIRQAIEEGGINRKEIIYNFSRLILLYLSNIMANTMDANRKEKEGIRGNRNSIIYGRFIRLVKENFRSHREVGFYAEQLCVTPVHLSRVVKAVSGKSVRDWIKEYVILEAKILLKSTDLSISAISDDLNFPNPSFFSKYFRKKTGETPKGYRGQ